MNREKRDSYLLDLTLCIHTTIHAMKAFKRVIKFVKPFTKTERSAYFSALPHIPTALISFGLLPHSSRAHLDSQKRLSVQHYSQSIRVKSIHQSRQLPLVKRWLSYFHPSITNHLFHLKCNSEINFTRIDERNATRRELAITLDCM